MGKFAKKFIIFYVIVSVFIVATILFLLSGENELQNNTPAVEASETYTEAIELAKTKDDPIYIKSTYDSKNEEIEKKKAMIDADNDLLYYNQLSETEKEFYWQIDYSINSFDYLVLDLGRTEFSNLLDGTAYTLSSAQSLNTSIDRAEEAYHYDNPDIYWAVFADYSEVIGDYYIADFKYYFSEKDNGYSEEEKTAFLADREDYYTELYRIEDLIKEKTDKIKDDWDKALFISKWICKNISYDKALADEESENATVLNGGIYSAVMNKTCVCRGYTQLYMYLMDSVGIPCQQCSGVMSEPEYTELPYELNGEEKTMRLPTLSFNYPGLTGYSDVNHIWNVARINGILCNVDVTSMDVDRKKIKYDFTFFGVSDHNIDITHKKKDILDAATCKSTKNSFFKHEKLFAKEITQESIENAIEYAIKNKYKYAFVQFKDPYDAERAYKKYVKDSLVLQNVLLKFNRDYDDIITIDEKRSYETSIDEIGGVLYIIL